jgi:hypothetical protein
VVPPLAVELLDARRMTGLMVDTRCQNQRAPRSSVKPSIAATAICHKARWLARARCIQRAGRGMSASSIIGCVVRLASQRGGSLMSMVDLPLAAESVVGQLWVAQLLFGLNSNQNPRNPAELILKSSSAAQGLPSNFLGLVLLLVCR